MLLVINSPQNSMVKGPLIKANCRENGKAGPTANFNWESFSYLRNYKVFTRQWRGLVSTLEIWTSLVSRKRICLQCRKWGSIPGLGRSPGEENGNSAQYSCLENFMDRGALRATVHGSATEWLTFSLHLKSSLDLSSCLGVYIIL